MSGMYPTKVAESWHGCQTDTIENNWNLSEMLEIESEFEEALKNVKETYSTPEETDEETDPKESKTLDDHSEIGFPNQNLNLIQSEPLVSHSECDLDNPKLVSTKNCLQKHLKSFPASETRLKEKKCAKGLEREVQFERLLSMDGNEEQLVTQEAYIRKIYSLFKKRLKNQTALFDHGYTHDQKDLRRLTKVKFIETVLQQMGALNIELIAQIRIILSKKSSPKEHTYQKPLRGINDHYFELKDVEFSQFATTLETMFGASFAGPYCFGYNKEYFVLDTADSVRIFFRVFVWNARVTDAMTQRLRCLDSTQWLRNMMQKFVDLPCVSLPGFGELSELNKVTVNEKLKEFIGLMKGTTEEGVL